jgi:uncharacterized protein
VAEDGDARLDLTERFVVPATVDRVWELFDDVPQVVACMPGARITEQVDGQTYTAQLAIAVGPIRPKFDIRATIERNDASKEGRINVDAVDKKGGSRARAQIVYKVAPEGAGGATAVELAQHVTLSGPLAQFGRTGVIEDINAQMTRQFADCLAGKLGTTHADSPAGDSSGNGASVSPTLTSSGGPSDASPGAAPAGEIRIVPLLAKTAFGRLLKVLRLRK